MGIWFMDAAILDGYRQLAAEHSLKEMKELSESVPAAAPVREMRGGKIGLIQLNGPTTKYKTSMQAITGGTSTLAMTKQIRKLGNEPQIGSILIDTDSFGGSAHGAFDWADEIAKVAKKKPVIFFGNGAMCSAAMLSASQGSYRIATPETQVGSIGVKAVLRDTSKMMEAAGVKVIAITSRKLKSFGEPGMPLTEEQINNIRKEIMDVDAMFLKYVSRGIGMSEKQIADLEAGSFLADEAKKIGLIDEVGDFDRAIEVAADAAINPVKFLSRKGGEPTDRGSGGSAGNSSSAAPQTTPASVEKGTRVMLDEKQLKQAKALPGAPADLNAENADVALLGIAENLAKNQKAPALASDQAQRYADIAQREIKHMAKEEKLNPEQEKALIALCTPSNVDAGGNVIIGLDKLQEVFNLNKPAGLVEEKTGTVAAPREIPGASKDNKKEDLEADGAKAAADYLKTLPAGAAK